MCSCCHFGSLEFITIYIYQLTFSINLYLLSEEDTIFNKILLVFSALPSTNFEYLVTSTVGQLVIMS